MQRNYYLEQQEKELRKRQEIKNNKWNSKTPLIDDGKNHKLQSFKNLERNKIEHYIKNCQSQTDIVYLKMIIIQRERQLLQLTPTQYNV